MSIYDYDEEEVRKVLAKEMAKEMAEEMAEKAVKENIISLVIKKVKKSKTLETIASELEEEEADIKPVYEAVIAAAPDYDIEKIKEKIIK